MKKQLKYWLKMPITKWNAKIESKNEKGTSNKLDIGNSNIKIERQTRTSNSKVKLKIKIENKRTI